MEFVDQKYWNQSYENFKFFEARDDLTRFMTRYAGAGAGLDCLEIGCYPGRYLAWLGRLGYRVHGCDLTDDIAGPRFRQWLTGLPVAVGELVCQDYTEFIAQHSGQYDLVVSVGFIEHFADYLTVIGRHWNAVKPGGRLIITTPNFAGATQHRLHRLIDPHHLTWHNIASMQPDQWRMVIEEAGGEVLFAGHFGRFDFWSDYSPKAPWQWAAYAGVFAAAPLLRRVLPDRPAWSPYCGLVARKPL
jgi:2-polyprenyl-3-methyl-5-hydroxy-6-metoxy-1,4-benzoquinol methylase